MGKLLENPVLVVMLLLLVVLLFGSKRLPDAARGVGRSLRIFKSETEGLMSTSATAEAAPVAVAPTAIAPVPAYKSRTCNPSKSPNSEASVEKSASRARSEVGRVADATASIFRPLARPAMILIVKPYL
jgi:sec-independent protein translocase protein TatA